MKKDISHITTYESGVIQSSAHRVLSRIKSDFLLQYDLTSMQWFVIGLVYESGSTGLRLNELMKVLDTTMPYITNVVNTLEAKDILHKVSDVHDSRVKIALLNPKYKKTVTEIEHGLRDELRQKLYREDQISREELATYISVLYKITQAHKN